MLKASRTIFCSYHSDISVTMATPAHMTMPGPAPAATSNMTMPGPAPAAISNMTMTGPAPAAQVTCLVCPKPREYKNKQGLTSHMKRIHQSAIEQVQKLSTILSPTPSLSSPAQSSPVQRTLSFSGSQQDGNTEDAIIQETEPVAAPPKSPIVNVNLTNQDVEAELEREEDFMEAAKEEIEVFETLADLADTAFDPQTEQVKRGVMKEKLNRYKDIMTKKDRILKATVEEVKSLKLSTETLKHDISMSKQVENHKETLIIEKENELKAASTRVKNLEKELKTTKEQNKANIDSLNETVGSLTKRNNELMTQIATENSLADASAREESADEVEAEVEVHAEENTQTVDMRNDITGHKCNACDRLFKASGDLDKHMRDKHEEYACNMCNKKFNSSKQAQEHICMVGDVIPQVCEKSYCKKRFVSSNALAKHAKNTHFGTRRSVCTKCSEILDESMDMKEHMETCGNEDVADTPQRSREVCRHWKKGRCDRGSQCNFSHVGRQDEIGPEQKSTNSAPLACRNGPSCSYLARGKCNFFHHITKRHNNREHQGERQHNARNYQGARYNGRENQGARFNGRENQGARHNGRENQGARGHGRRQQDNRARCRFGRDCDRVPNCPFIHSMEDFPTYNKSHGFRATRLAGNNRRRN